MSRAKKLPANKNKDTHNLWEEFIKDRNNIEIKNKLVQYYYPMVRKMGSMMYGKLKGKIQREDIISYAIDGLYKSMQVYTLDKNTKFETFAYQRIFGSIIDTLRQQDWVPRSVKLRSQKIQGIKNDIITLENRQPSELEIVQKAGFQEKSYKQRRNKFFVTQMSSLESNNGLDSNIQEIDQAQNEYLVSKEPSSYSKLIKNEFFETVIVKNLNNEEHNVIVMKYYQGRNVTEISRKLNRDVKEINSIHRSALKKMKELAEKGTCQYLKAQSIQQFNINK